MRTYETPGVYYERTDTSAGGIGALRTDVAGFVGIAERGPVGIAVPIASARQFTAWFGSPINAGYLAYNARAFFENGGRRMWVVRVASDAASISFYIVSDSAGPVWRIEASSPGVWGNSLSVRVVEVRREQTRAMVDIVDRSRLLLERTAGFDGGVLIELSVGTLAERAVVQSIDAVARTLLLERPLVTLARSAAVLVETIAYNIYVFASGHLVALYHDVSLVPTHARYGPALLKQPWQTIDPARPEDSSGRAPESDLAADYFRTARNRLTLPPPPIVIRELRDQAARDALNLLVAVAGASTFDPVPLSGGADGLSALRASDFIGAAHSPLASPKALAASRRGLAAVDIVDEVSLLVAPDIHIQPRPVHTLREPQRCQPDPCMPTLPMPPAPAAPPVGDMPPRFSDDEIYAVQAAIIDQCERRRDRVALLDAPFDTCNRLTLAANELKAWRARFDSEFATLYAPWLLVVDPLRGRSAAAALTRAIPPSGHVAGQCAALDLRAGVHSAPANQPLAWVQDVSLAFDPAVHGLLNSLGINIICAQAGRGVRVLGARTLSSDTDWRFLNVRRLVSMIEKAIEVSIQWAVFEPNDWRTRSKLKLVIDVFLRELWARGAMVGASAEEAFYVRCDETNNPAEIRALGQLLIEIGVAPTVPFEFIVMRIGRDANGFEITTAEQEFGALAG